MPIKRQKTNGKTHPTGMVLQHELFVTPQALKYIAVCMFRCKESRSINYWDFAFPKIDA